MAVQICSPLEKILFLFVAENERKFITNDFFQRKQKKKFYFVAENKQVQVFRFLSDFLSSRDELLGFCLGGSKSSEGKSIKIVDWKNVKLGEEN